MRFIGIAELLGAVGLVLPMLTGIAPVLTVVAAIGLVLVQILAAGYHLSRGEGSRVPMNAVLLVLAVVIVYGRLAVVPGVAQHAQRPGRLYCYEIDRVGPSHGTEGGHGGRSHGTKGGHGGPPLPTGHAGRDAPYGSVGAAPRGRLLDGRPCGGFEWQVPVASRPAINHRHAPILSLSLKRGHW